MPRSSTPRPRSFHSPGLIPPAPSSSRPLSRTVPVQHVNSVSYRPASTPRRLRIDRAPPGSSSQRARASRSISLIDTVEPNLAQMDHLIAQQPARAYAPSPSHPPDPISLPRLLASPHPASSLIGPTLQVVNSPAVGSSGQYSQQRQRQNQSQGMFNNAHNFVVTGTIIENNVTHNNTTSNKFMKEFLMETIPGAAFDSSARDPPPRCHPGTRLAVLKRCIDFIGTCEGEKKIRWVVGAAGVGKSAVMQNVAESPNLPVTSQASVFFSVNGRNDGTKAIKTISYQLAAKSESYRQLIEQEIVRDPSLLESSMAVQFRKLIVDPFIHNPQLNSAGRVLVIIDGLDECKNASTQQELLRLISDFCIMYPSSPLVWLIASRPEPHITSFFSRIKVIPTYEKEGILVDSNEGRADVERFLRQELMEIKETSDSLVRYSQWPEEPILWKIADAAGGLFAYADTVVKYVGDLAVGDPASQLSDVLHVIDNHPMDNVPREQHPMALLDALYARILSNVPSKTMIHTRKLLLLLATDWSRDSTIQQKHFVLLCNWLALTPDEAYAAVNHLRSVLRVPRIFEAHEQELRPFHKSFIDYISNSDRSTFFHDIRHEAQRLKTERAFRVFKEASDGFDFGRMDCISRYGALKSVPGTGDKISLTWPVDQRVRRWDNKKTRRGLYELAIGQVVAGIDRREPFVQSEFCVRPLTTQFRAYDVHFPYVQLSDLVLNESRRDEFLMLGILKQVPLKEVPIFKILDRPGVKMRFRRPAAPPTVDALLRQHCHHERQGEWAEGKDQDWVTTFDSLFCSLCFDQFEMHLGSWRARYPDHAVTVMHTSTRRHLVEIRSVEPEDSIMSEWTYTFWTEQPQ